MVDGCGNTIGRVAPLELRNLGRCLWRTSSHGPATAGLRNPHLPLWSGIVVQPVAGLRDSVWHCRQQFFRGGLLEFGLDSSASEGKLSLIHISEPTRLL